MKTVHGLAAALSLAALLAAGATLAQTGAAPPIPAPAPPAAAPAPSPIPVQSGGKKKHHGHKGSKTRVGTTSTVPSPPAPITPPASTPAGS